MSRPLSSRITYLNPLWAALAAAALSASLQVAPSQAAGPQPATPVRAQAPQAVG